MIGLLILAVHAVLEDPMSQAGLACSSVFYCKGECSVTALFNVTNVCTLPSRVEFSNMVATPTYCGSQFQHVSASLVLSGQVYLGIVEIMAAISMIFILVYLAWVKLRGTFALLLKYSMVVPWVLGGMKRAQTRMDAVKEGILRYLSIEGAATLYDISRALGLSYGSVQWHIYVLERMNKVHTRKVMGKVYVYIDEKVGLERILRDIDIEGLRGRELRDIWDVVTRASQLGIISTDFIRRISERI